MVKVTYINQEVILHVYSSTYIPQQLMVNLMFVIESVLEVGVTPSSNSIFLWALGYDYTYSISVLVHLFQWFMIYDKRNLGI